MVLKALGLLQLKLFKPAGVLRAAGPAVCALVLAACSLPYEQLSLPGPIGGGQTQTGTLPNPKGTALGDPATPGAAGKQIYQGSGQFATSPPISVGQSSGGQSSGGQSSAGQGTPGQSKSLGVATGEGVTLDLVNASIPEATKTILGEVLRVPYTISDQVRGSVTLQTAKPMNPDGLLEVFESVLASNGAALVVDQGVYRVVTRDEALSSGRPVTRAAPSGARGPGIGTEVFPLRYVAAVEMERILKSIAPSSNVARVDSVRNLVVVSGSRTELAQIAETVRMFDVDYMRGMSFGIFPIETSDVEAIAQELDTIFATDPQGSAKGLVKFVPNARLKAVLVITSRPEYLRKAETWIKRIDQAAEATEKRAYVYQVQYRPVQELVVILQRLYPAKDTGRGQASVRQGGAASGALPVDAVSASDPELGGTGGATGSTTRPNPIRIGGGIAPPLTAAQIGGAQPETPSAGGAVLPSDPNAPLDGNQAAAGGAGTLPALGAQLAAREPDDRNTGVSFVADDANNAVVVSASPSEWKRIRQVLAEIDVKPAQVLIEATIAEVTLTDDLKFGLRWFFEKGASQFRLTDTLATGAIGAIAPAFPGFAYFLNTTDAKVALNALADITNVNIVSSPSLMVLNNKKAVLQIGDQVPIATQQAVATDAALAPIVNAISFRETGVLLTIIPRISDDGQILLDIEQEVSDAKATDTSDIDSPTIAQRRIKTTVTVANGGSIVLAGMMQDKATRKRQQIPLAGDIPLLGNLFKNKDDEILRTELMIAITPHIIKDESQIGMIAAEFRDKLNFNTRPQRETLPEHREQLDRITR